QQAGIHELTVKFLLGHRPGRRCLFLKTLSQKAHRLADGFVWRREAAEIDLALDVALQVFRQMDGHDLALPHPLTLPRQSLFAKRGRQLCLPAMGSPARLVEHCVTDGQAARCHSWADSVSFLCVNFGGGDWLQSCPLTKTVGKWWGNGYRKTAEKAG